MRKKIVFGLLLTLLLGTASIPAKAPSEAGNNYVFVFRVTKYDSKLADSVAYIFKKMIKPGDRLTLFTPVKSYNYSSKTLSTQPADKLVSVTQNALKRDISIGTSDHNQILANMLQVVRNLNDMDSNNIGEADLKNSLVAYRQQLNNIRAIRKFTERFYLGLAQSLKNLKGKNSIFVFFQKQFRPVPKSDTMLDIKAIREVKFDAMSLFELGIDEEFMDTDKVGGLLKEAATTVNLIYINLSRGGGLSTQNKELSADIYSSISKIAKITGGIVETTSKPVKVLKKIKTN